MNKGMNFYEMFSLQRLMRYSLILGAFALLQASFGFEKDAESAQMAKVNVVNKGIPGASSKDGLLRFSRIVEQDPPQHLILYFGINDSCNSHKLVSVADFKSNITQMVDRAQNAGVETVILVTPNPVVETYLLRRHPKHPEKDRLSEHVAKYAEAVKEVAAEKELPLADLHAMVEKSGGATEATDSLLRNEENSNSADGVHLTAEGYRRFAELLVPILEDRVEPEDTILCFGDSITYGVHVRGAGTSTGETYPGRLAEMLNERNKQ